MTVVCFAELVGTGMFLVFKEGSFSLAESLTSNSLGSTREKNPREQPTFFSCLHSKLLVYCSLRNSGYKRGKNVGCSQGLNQVNWMLVIWLLCVA